MRPSLVVPGIHRVSTNTRGLLFEGIWPIPNGVSLNSYVVHGAVVALVDGFCGWDGVPETLFAQLAELGIELADIKYVIINHMEPDHSGWFKPFAELRGSGFEVVCSPKAVPLLKAFYGWEGSVRTVKDGDTLDLGDGRVLAFVEIPNVHWPETIATFDVTSGTLMPCDAFGTFGEVGEAAYDDQLSPAQVEFYEKEAIRYYSNIVAAFSYPTRKAIEKAAALLGDKLRVIAPAHGIVWRKNPLKIVADYQRYVAWQNQPARAEVTVIWGSMYGNTASALPPILQGLRDGGVVVHEHRVPETHIGDILASAWTSSGIVLGMPTYEFKMFPPMFAVVDELFKKKLHQRLAFRFGSYGWCGGAQAELDDLVARHKPGWQWLTPVEFQGHATTSDLDQLWRRGQQLAQGVRDSVDQAAWVTLESIPAPDLELSRPRGLVGQVQVGRQTQRLLAPSFS